APETTAEPVAETRNFQAEVSRLLDIVAHSLYSEKEIFLRELISNASDACDRLRYAALTEPSLAEGDASHRVVLTPVKSSRTLTVADNGIGMNHDELVENLGTIARSGTAAFVSELTGDAKKDMSLIGQFGVGFYSAFMVADKVEVLSRKAGEAEGWRWTSDGKGSFTIEPAANVPRGLRIVLHIREGDEEYLDPQRIRQIVKRYSDHIALPIVLADGNKEETINVASALWTRPRSEITPEQYKEFYHHVAHSFDEPWLTLHGKAEGVLEYSFLLFVPAAKPFDLFDPERKSRLKLYVRRVFITEEGTELVPRHLRGHRPASPNLATRARPLNNARRADLAQRLYRCDAAGQGSDLHDHRRQSRPAEKEPADQRVSRARRRGLVADRSDRRILGHGHRRLYGETIQIGDARRRRSRQDHVPRRKGKTGKTRAAGQARQPDCDLQISARRRGQGCAQLGAADRQRGVPRRRRRRSRHA